MRKKNQEKYEKYEKSEKMKKKMKVVVLLNKSYVCIKKLLAREVHMISD